VKLQLEQPARIAKIKLLQKLSIRRWNTDLSGSVCNMWIGVTLIIKKYHDNFMKYLLLYILQEVLRAII
jgi:hypothetical protein